MPNGLSLFCVNDRTEKNLKISKDFISTKNKFKELRKIHYDLR